jgi:glucose/arabinose dehydrogenase
LFATGLDTPWGMAFLPDGRMIVTEKTGTLRLIDADGTVSEPVGGVPEVCACGQGGLLDVQVHPNYDENRWIYFTYSDRREDDQGEPIGFTALMRARLDGLQLVDQETLWQAPAEAYTGRGQHFGSRIVFDEDGYLYFTIGDRGAMEQAQDVSHPNGKVHRLHDDGRVPDDNPFVDTPGAVTSIWSYGHGNPQGLDRNPQNGTLWNAEHGPQGGDELNYVRKGLNFGWPVITYGINYDDTPITDTTEKEGMEQPAFFWLPSIATCGISFYHGDLIPEWKNSLFVASLKFGRIHRLVIQENSVIHEEIYHETGGRPRDIVTGPDGYLYIAIEDAPGRIIRLVPAEA